MADEKEKIELKERVLKARKDYPGGTKTAQFNLAVARFVLDAAGIKDQKQRKAGVDALMSAGFGFGNNLSGFEQNTGLRDSKSTDVAKFSGEA